MYFNRKNVLSVHYGEVTFTVFLSTVKSHNEEFRNEGTWPFGVFREIHPLWGTVVPTLQTIVKYCSGGN